MLVHARIIKPNIQHPIYHLGKQRVVYLTGCAGFIALSGLSHNQGNVVYSKVTVHKMFILALEKLYIWGKILLKINTKLHNKIRPCHDAHSRKIVK